MTTSRVTSVLRRTSGDRAVRTAVLFLGSQAVVAAVSLALNVVSARVLGPAGRGELAMYMQLAQVASIFSALGVDQAYPAALPARPTIAQAVADLWRLVRWSTAAVAAVAAVAVAAAGGSSGPRVVLSVGFALFAVLLVFSRVLAAASAAVSSARRQFATVCAWQTALLTGGCALALSEVRSVGAWLLLVGAAGIAPFAVALFGSRRHVRPSGVDLGRVRALGLKLVPAALLNLLMLRSERLILPALASFDQLGIYIVVATMTEVVGMPMLYFLQAKTPDLADRIRQRSLRYRRALLLGLGYGVGGGVAGGAVVAVLLVPVFGEEYARAVPLAVPLGLVSGLYAFSRLGAAICIAAHEPRWNTVMDLIGLVAGVAGCVALAPAHGAAGVTVATLVSNGLVAAVSVVATLAVARRYPYAPVAARVDEPVHTGQ